MQRDNSRGHRGYIIDTLHLESREGTIFVPECVEITNAWFLFFDDKRATETVYDVKFFELDLVLFINRYDKVSIFTWMQSEELVLCGAVVQDALLIGADITLGRGAFVD